MKLKQSLSALSLAIAATMPLALPTAVHAETAPTISIGSMGVQPVPQLVPGEVLSFTLDGTPGAAVTLQIAGATAPVQMRETRPGHYDGEYTVRRSDRLSAASRVTSRVVKDGRMASATLSQSLVLGAPSPAPLQTAQITDFDVEGPSRVRPGDELSFRLVGTPGGKAVVSIAGIARPIVLREVSRGVYEGSYVVRRQDRLRGELVADASLVSDRREVTQRYENVGNAGRGDRGSNDGERGQSREDAARDVRPAAVATCATCGTIQSVDLVEIDGQSPNVIGTVAGGLLGGVLGHQVGGGTGKDLATIIGAVGGAYAGNRVENSRDKVKVHRVSVRIDGGAVQSFDYAQDPAVTVGTRVKVENGLLIRL